MPGAIMFTTSILAIITTLRPMAEWVPEVTIALRLGAAGISFGVAVHRAVHCWRTNRER
jgi:hypothetical protein